MGQDIYRSVVKFNNAAPFTMFGLGYLGISNLWVKLLGACVTQ